MARLETDTIGLIAQIETPDRFRYAVRKLLERPDDGDKPQLLRLPYAERLRLLQLLKTRLERAREVERRNPDVTSKTRDREAFQRLVTEVASYC